MRRPWLRRSRQPCLTVVASHNPIQGTLIMRKLLTLLAATGVLALGVAPSGGGNRPA